MRRIVLRPHNSSWHLALDTLAQNWAEREAGYADRSYADVMGVLRYLMAFATAPRMRPNEEGQEA
jgi:hypothetical protein